jgi:putative spermidine/putrescine transport system permease protein
MATTVSQPTRPPGARSRISAALFRHPKGRLVLIILAPIAWMVLVYLISLILLLATSFWKLDPLTSTIQRDWGLQNYSTIITSSTYTTITIRTVTMALAVTAADLLFAFPIAFFAARMATPRIRGLITLLVVIPLWANYLIRVFAWKTLLSGGGPVDALLSAIGLGDVSLASTRWAVWITFCYLWLPFAILPIYASLERVPPSFLEASSDLGAHAGVTFRKVVFPLAIPGIVAGSIFTFSLTLGDYLTPTLVGKELFLGNAISSLTGTANNKPLAAAIAVIPIVIVVIYLSLAKRTGAFEAL